MIARAARVVVVALAAAACGKSSSSGGSSSRGDAISPDAEAGGARAAPETPAVLDLWARAKDGEADDLQRLCQGEGSDRLIELATDPARRVVALRALAFAEDFTPLPFLADVAVQDTDEDAAAALLSAATLAAEPRRATDPEDALELGEGARRLLALAREPKAPAARRVLAIRVLRLLADRGAVAPKDVPSDLDSH